VEAVLKAGGLRSWKVILPETEWLKTPLGTFECDKFAVLARGVVLLQLLIKDDSELL